jgi:GNAT superfamily N-acetyltransferase
VVTGELIVARGDDDEPVGFVGFELDRGGYERDRTRGIVSNLFVVPDRRGEGIGADLLDAAERALREAGAETVALEALAANDRAREFYAERGYEPHRVELTKSLAADDGSDGDEEGDGGDGEGDPSH